jgi:regulatory protein
VKKKPEPSLRLRAMKYLAQREYARHELRAKLLPYAQSESDDFGQIQSSPEIDALLDDLVARGYLSDERAVTQLLHSKRSRYGSQRLTHELRQKGIAETLIDDAIPALKETEFSTAQSVWQRKFGVLPQDAKEKAKQMRFLQSRGFALEVIFKVIKAAAVSDTDE